MSAVYIETSAVLSWLLGEEDAQPVIDCIDGAKRAVTSILTRLVFSVNI